MPPPPEGEDADACAAAFAASLRSAIPEEDPYRHWVLSRTLPRKVAESLRRLPIPAPELSGISGARELHNNTRRYFDPQAIEVLKTSFVDMGILDTKPADDSFMTTKFVPVKP